MRLSRRSPDPTRHRWRRQTTAASRCPLLKSRCLCTCPSDCSRVSSRPESIRPELAPTHPGPWGEPPLLRPVQTPQLAESPPRRGRGACPMRARCDQPLCARGIAPDPPRETWLGHAEMPRRRCLQARHPRSPRAPQPPQSAPLRPWRRAKLLQRAGSETLAQPTHPTCSRATEPRCVHHCRPRLLHPPHPAESQQPAAQRQRERRVGEHLCSVAVSCACQPPRHHRSAP